MKLFPYKHIPEFDVFKKLNSPEKIQDFINTIPANFEPDGDVCRSPLMVLQKNIAHCVEGAFLSASILWYHNEKPLLLDLKTKKTDFDHVVTLFKRDNLWGAISKTNHGVLRYRDPIFKTVRELAMSYFNEYFTDDGDKTLISYSAPFSLLPYNPQWVISPDDLWDIPADLDDSKHFPIAHKSALKKLRRADSIEREIGKITEWKR